MYVLIDKIKRVGYSSESMLTISEESRVSYNTIRTWNSKINDGTAFGYMETTNHLFIITKNKKSKRGNIENLYKHD
jgi:hypothetical protein